MATIKTSNLPLPSDRNLQFLVGNPSKIIKDQSDGLQSTKTVHFNKDIILEKMKVFKDIISYFNKLETNPHGSFAANTAYDWVVQQFAEDIYASLGLHKLEWEFDFLTKFVKKDKAKKPSDEIILDESVESFLHKSRLGSNFRPHNGIEIDLDKDLEERSDPVSLKGLGGKNVKVSKPTVNRIGKDVEEKKAKVKSENTLDDVIKSYVRKQDDSLNLDSWRDQFKINIEHIKDLIEKNKAEEKKKKAEMEKETKKTTKPKVKKTVKSKGKKKHV